MVLSQSDLSKKYALAYVNVYFDTLSLDDIDHVRSCIIFLQRNHHAIYLLSLPSIDKNYRFIMLQKLCERFKLPDSLCKLMHVLMQAKMLLLLVDVLRDICFVFKQRKKIMDVDVSVAHALDNESKKKFVDFFAKASGHTIIPHVRIDHSLIAGIRMQSNTLLWESSVACSIKKLRQSLNV